MDTHAILFNASSENLNGCKMYENGGRSLKIAYQMNEFYNKFSLFTVGGQVCSWLNSLKMHEPVNLSGETLGYA